NPDGRFRASPPQYRETGRSRHRNRPRHPRSPRPPERYRGTGSSERFPDEMPTRISDELFERGMKYARPGNNQNGRQFPTHRHMPDESNLVREAKETYAFNEDEFVPCDAIGAGA